MNAVRLQRTIPADPDDVYRAWLEPALLARWMGPGGLTVARAEVDERVGGHYRIFEADGDTDAGGFDAQILALEPGRRLVFRWGFVGPRRREGPAFDSLLTITLAPSGDGGTELSLVHEQLDALAAAMPEVAAQVAAGWASALDNLTGVRR